jgi:phage RecT family recombinase
MSQLAQLKEVLIKASDKLKVLGLDKATIEKETGYALQIVNSSKQLSKCSPKSIATAVVNIAGTGLSLNPFKKESYLVPRWDSKSKSMAACLEPSYQGLQKLAMEAGAVKRMTTQVVYQNDVFEIDLADDMKPVTHKPALSDRGNVVGVYCLSTLPDDAKQVEWMEYIDILQIRDSSESFKAFQAKKIPTCVWNDHEGEMIRKTVIRRAVKYLPKVNDSDNLSNAIALDQEDYSATSSQMLMIESLLKRANISPEESSEFNSMLSDNIGRFEAQDAINYLQANQLDDTPAYGGSGAITALGKAANETAAKTNS